jgi:predicted methyltransferase
MMRGIRERDFPMYAEIFTRLVNENYLARENGRIFLTDKGMDFANRVFVELV